MSDPGGEIPASEPKPSATPAPTGVGQPRPGIPPNIQQMVASKRLQQAQAQVGEVVDIMRVNVEKVLERDQKLSELDRRADDLQEGASQFQQQAVKLKRKAWWENIKMWIIIGVILLVVILIIIVSTTSATQGGRAAGGLPSSSPERVLEDGVSSSAVAGTGADGANGPPVPAQLGTTAAPVPGPAAAAAGVAAADAPAASTAAPPVNQATQRA